MNKYKILALIANHTNSQIKYNISLNNISLIKDYVTDICIIDTKNELYAQKLNNDIIKLYNNIIQYIYLDNNHYYDFGKWINTLQNIDYKKYDYILFLNDSVILSYEIKNYFVYIENVMKSDTQLYAYNDSSQVKYHYQSYLFLLNINSVPTFIHFFESRKNNITDLCSLVENIELNMCEIVKNHDCFLKIADEYNSLKNIHWENEQLYEYLLSKKIIAIIKLKRIFYIQKTFKLTIYGHSIDNFDYNYYKTKYADLSNLTDSELLQHFINIGQYEGRKFNQELITILPKYYREKLKIIGILQFFDLPEDFDIYYYRFYNKDLKDLPIIDIIFHYMNNGLYEGRQYKKDHNNINLNSYYLHLLKINDQLPNDFNINSYILLNNLYTSHGYIGAIYDYFNSNKKKPYKKSLLDEKIANLDLDIYKRINSIINIDDINIIIQQYLHNNKIYKIPIDFNHAIYRKLNKDLKKLNNSQLEEHYILYGISEHRLYRIPDDFNTNIYRSLYKDLKNIPDEKIIEHYISIGYSEGRIYSIPKDFNSDMYKRIYKDMSKLSDIKLKEHYMNYGINEGRIYKVPDDFNPFKYKLIHKDLEKLSENELIEHYLLIGKRENRQYKIPDDFDPKIYQKIYSNLKHLTDKEITEYYFNCDLVTNKIYKLPEDFDPIKYRDIYRDLSDLSDDELRDHYLTYGIRSGRIYKLPIDFNAKNYKNIYSDLKKMSDEELVNHYITIGIKEGRIYKLPDDFNCALYKEIYSDLSNLNDKELINHYMTHGIKEKRYYGLPKNFNHSNYRKLNKDLTKFTDDELTKHYLLYGIKEKRPYK